MKDNLIKRAVLAFLILTSILTTGYSNPGFIENIGQITDQDKNLRPDILAKYPAGKGLNIFLSHVGIHYQYRIANGFYRMDVKLIGANPAARISKENQLTFTEKYILSGLTGSAYSFGTITYHDVYPGIDWEFYFNKHGNLEHDFIIKPGGRVSDIRLEYLGAESLKIDANGHLIATTKYGTIREPKPLSFELETNKKINSAYVLNGNTLSFKTGKYNGVLVIDPVIDWSTYFGGTEYDDLKDVKTGKDGFVYTVGSTNSTTNIATVGAHLVNFQGGMNSSGSDAFISKFAVDGTCIWSTYYGGPNVDVGLSLDVDSTGNLLIAGRTNSTTGISTPGSHQSVKAGNISGYDAFLLKMDTAGTPVWSSYFGGNFNEGTVGLDICVDRYNNIYLAGNTNSSIGIATTGAYQLSKAGSDDGFIAKFDNQGTLLWSTFYGAALSDNINSITTDTTGNLIIVGHTQSFSGLSTANVHLEIGNGNIDGFIAKFNSAGQRIWGSYYGGAGYDIFYSVTIDSTNAIYCSGRTNSNTDIASSNAYQTTIGGTEDDAFITKFNPDGSLNWSTYYGGPQSESSHSLLFYRDKLYFSGTSASSTNITTPDGIVPVYNNSISEGVLATFTPNGQKLWATYLGGDGGDVPRAITINESDEIFIAGETLSPTGLSTTGAHQTSFGGDRDGWVIKINMCELPPTPSLISGSTEICENTEQQYSISPANGADSFFWILPAGWIGSSNTDTIHIIAGSASGEVSVVALNGCGASDTVSLAVTVKPSPQPTINRNGSILSVTQPFISYQWLLNGNPINGATGMTYIALENGIYTIKVQADNDCFGLSNKIIVDDMVSIDNLLKQNGIRIYPNPFSSKVYIESATSLNLQVIDISGKRILTRNGIKDKSELDLHDLPVGNFYIKFFDQKTNAYLGAAVMVKAEQ